MVQGKCPHPWNRTKEGTFRKGHKQINQGKGQFKKGQKITEKLRSLNREKGKERYAEGIHPFLIKNMIAHQLANKNKFYGIGKCEWKRLSKKILKRDKFICQSCGKCLRKHKHNVHHILPFIFSHNNSEDNLVSLCIPCHTSIEYYTQKALGGINEKGDLANGEKIQKGNIPFKV